MLIAVVEIADLDLAAVIGAEIDAQSAYLPQSKRKLRAPGRCPTAPQVKCWAQDAQPSQVVQPNTKPPPSLAHLTGGQVVGGSNPPSPTKIKTT